MLARVKWRSNKWRPDGKMPTYEYGTLLAVVHTGHETHAVIAVDTGGAIIEKSIGLLTVTTRFDWNGPPVTVTETRAERDKHRLD